MQPSSNASTPGIVGRALHALVSQIPPSAETPSLTPTVRAHELARSAAIRAATMSGSFTLPPGPLGMATVLPDLLGIWRMQQQLVADIAATFGRTAALTRETMLICLFKHGGAAITQRLLARGENDNVVVHRITNRALQQMLEKIAIRIGQRIAAKSVSRWLPILGALGAGAYAYYDTTHVATNAIDLFSKPLLLKEAAAAGGADDSATTEKDSGARTRSTSRRRAASSSAAQKKSKTPKDPQPSTRRSRKSAPPGDAP